LGWYWVCRHRSVEARRWLVALLAGEAALATLPDVSPEVLKRGKAGLLLAAGEHRWNSPESRPLWEQSLALYRELGDQRGVARALNSLGGLVLALGDLVAAQTLNEEALALSRELGTKAGIANALNHLSLVAKRQEDGEKAQTLRRQALVAAREVDDWFARADSVFAIASGLSIERAFGAAEPVWEEFGRIAREHGDMEGTARALCGLGLAAYGQGNYSTARDRYLQGMAPPTAGLVPPYFIIQLAGVEMEIVLRAQGQPDPAGQDSAPAAERAVRLLGAGAALMADELDRIEQAISAFVMTSARGILGEPAFTAALAQGRAMPAEQVYAYALAGAGEPDGEGPDPAARFDGAPPPAYLIAPPAAGIELPGAGHADTREP
jgi:tetratricopeptide (TPR) repeat protein